MGEDKQGESSAKEMAAALAALQSQLDQVSGQLAKVIGGAPEAARRVARGTPSPRGRGTTRQRVIELEKPAPARPADIADRIKLILVGEWEHGGQGERLPMSLEQIARGTGDTVKALGDALQKLESAGRVTQLAKGGDVRLWAWRPGPSAENAERRSAIVGLLMAEPLTHGELIKITGAQPKQIENDIVEIRRKEPVWWMNKGAKVHGNVYWISPDRRPPPSELDGRLEPKRAPNKKRS